MAEQFADNQIPGEILSILSLAEGVPLSSADITMQIFGDFNPVHIRKVLDALKSLESECRIVHHPDVRTQWVLPDPSGPARD